MKKATVKAAKASESTPKTSPKKKTVKKVATVAPAPRKAKASPPKAPMVKPSPAQMPPTEITAAVDVGFGNTLFIRGEGPGLSWETGVPMACVADDKWSILLPGTGQPVVYKVLINDLSWCAGDDFVTASGERVTITPAF